MAIHAPHGHHGYSTIVEPGCPTIQRDTVQCGHCDAVIDLKPGSGITVYLIPLGFVEGQPIWQEEAGAFCRVCMRPVCLTCHDRNRGTCDPFEKKLARMEGRKG